MQPAVEDLFEQWRRRGDHRALAALFDRTAPELWRVARHLSRNASEAEDLLQGTFLAVMESADRFRAGQALVPWMLGILANKLRMARRRQRLRDALSPARPQPVEDPLAAAEASEVRELLRVRLATLPEVYRVVLLLQFEHGLSATEIAHTLDRPLATVRSQVYRGLELLRRALPAGMSARPDDGEPAPDLRSVRGAVLMAAGGKATVAATFGVTLMAKKLLVGAAVLLCAGLWYGWPRPENTQVTAAASEATPAAQPLELVAAAKEQTAPPPPAARHEVDGAPRGAGSLRVHVLWADGTAAASMAVCVQPAGNDADWFAQRWQATDARGAATYEALAPGKVQVRARHGGTVDAEIAAGVTAEVSLTIPAGIDVRGTVVDPKGQLVSGAIVVVGPRPDEMLEATRTDANGVFLLRSMSDKNLVGAFAEGFGHSLAVRAKESKNGSLELRLAGPGGSVAGRVLDAEGRPLAGAWVAHGYGEYEQPPLVPMRVEITDASGAFRLQGLPLATPWPLHVGAAGHAGWKGSVRVTADSVPFVEVRLERAVRLHGVVRGPGGEPVRGFVAVIDRNAPGKKIQDPRPRWSRPFRATGVDGAYAFAGLRAGPLLVAAHDKGDNVAAIRLDAQPGDDLVWDATLTRERAIRGTLLDDGGRPLAGWRVVADAAEGVPLPDQVATAADGSFALVGCVQAAHTIRCYCPGNEWHEAIVEQRGVEPDGEPLVLRARRTAMPSCVVSGRLAADQTGESHLLLVGERLGMQMKGPLRPGETFELAAVPPGRYTVQLQRLAAPGAWSNQLTAVLLTRELQAGERLDLGEVRMPELGEVAVTLVDAAGRAVPEATVTLGLIGSAMNVATISVRDGKGAGSLAPGVYVLAGGGRVCIEHPPIAVAAGSRRELRLQVAATVHRQVRYDLTAAGGPMRAVGTWKKAGTALLRHTFHFWQEHPSTIEHDFTPGSWVLELELGNGSVQTFPFVVTADDTAPVIEVKVTG
ncbi:MAG TPA: sigma-70 family RNA polymerase sigma factor [Planctomycetota bacterium]